MKAITFRALATALMVPAMILFVPAGWLAAAATGSFKSRLESTPGFLKSAFGAVWK